MLSCLCHTMTTADKLLTIKEVSEDLRVSTRTVYRLIKSGELPTVKLGNCRNAPVRVYSEDLGNWINSKLTVDPTSTRSRFGLGSDCAKEPAA